MVVTCPGCGHLILASEPMAEQSVRCPICERVFVPELARHERPDDQADTSNEAALAAGRPARAMLAADARKSRTAEGRYVGKAEGAEGSLDGGDPVHAGPAGKAAPAVKLKQGKTAIGVTAGKGRGRLPEGQGGGDGTYVSEPDQATSTLPIPVPASTERVRKPGEVEPAGPAGPAPAEAETPISNGVSLRECAALSEDESDPFDTALVALALSEVIDEPALPPAGYGQMEARREVWMAAGIVLLWAFRTVLVLCGVTTLLPWMSANAGSPGGAAGAGSVNQTVDLFGLSPASAGVILLCLGACLGVSFVASRRPVFRTVLVLQMLVTCVAVLIPFALHSAPGGGGRRAFEGMAWGAWACLAMCGLAWAGAMAYLLVPTRELSAAS